MQAVEKWKRTHGLIGQEFAAVQAVEKAMQAAGVAAQSFAAVQAVEKVRSVTQWLICMIRSPRSLTL